MTGKILRLPAVVSRTGLSRSTIYAKLDPKSLYHDATFPKPVKLGLRAVGWKEAAVTDWLQTREAA